MECDLRVTCEVSALPRSATRLDRLRIGGLDQQGKHGARHAFGRYHHPVGAPCCHDTGMRRCIPDVGWRKGPMDRLTSLRPQSAPFGRNTAKQRLLVALHRPYVPHHQ
jgi:hypothetical protein